MSNRAAFAPLPLITFRRHIEVCDTKETVFEVDFRTRQDCCLSCSSNAPMLFRSFSVTVARKHLNDPPRLATEETEARHLMNLENGDRPISCYGVLKRNQNDFLHPFC